MPVDYKKVLGTLLESHRQAGTSLSTSRMFSCPELGSSSDKTKMKHLKEFLGKNAEYVGTVQGVLPPTESIIDMAEKQLGEPICEANIIQANRICADIVGKATGPLVEEFVRSGLASSISDDKVSLTIHNLV